MRIPVIVLSGFLGSGKTTLLITLLEEAAARGLKPGVLVNELGKADVDGSIVKNQAGDALQLLLDGCICCSKKGELSACMKQLLERNPDLILIELTGVANPEEIVEVMAEPGLQEQIELRHIVTVLDAENVLEYNSFLSADRELIRTVRRQMEVADTVLINKTDLVKESVLAKVDKAVRKQNEQAVIHHTSYSKMNLSALFHGMEPRRDRQPVTAGKVFKVVRGAHAHKHAHDHTHDHAHTHDHGSGQSKSQPSFTRVRSIMLSIPSGSALSQKQVEQFIKKQPGLLRAKGYISEVKTNKAFLMQTAGGRTYWQPAIQDSEPYLVLIGIDLDEDKISKHWEELVAGI